MKPGDLVVRIWLGKRWWNMLGIIISVHDDNEKYNVLWWVDGQLTTGISHYKSMCSSAWSAQEMEVINETW